MLKQSQTLSASAASIAAFVTRFGDRIPDGVGHIGLSYDFVPECDINTGGLDDPDDRNKVLSLVAEVWGNTNWIANLNYERSAFNWTRTIDGIRITIHRAELAGPVQSSFPVPPNKFPIQLTEFTN